MRVNQWGLMAWLFTRLWALHVWSGGIYNQYMCYNIKHIIVVFNSFQLPCCFGLDCNISISALSGKEMLEKKLKKVIVVES